MEQFRRVRVSIHGMCQNMSEKKYEGGQDRGILKLIGKEKEMWNIRFNRGLCPKIAK